MNLSRVINYTIENGGVSYSIQNGEINPKIGYMVGLNNEIKVPLNEFNDNILKKFILNNIEQLTTENNFLGTWIYKDYVYIDVSALITDIEKALNIAREYNEIAIWDNKNQRNLYLSNKISFSEFKNSLIHKRTEIFIPVLNTSINKSKLIIYGMYSNSLEKNLILNAYLEYLTK